MAPRKARQSFDTNVVKKNDNVQTLLKQRTEAREEVERIMQWVNNAGARGQMNDRISGELHRKLEYLFSRTLREDV